MTRRVKIYGPQTRPHFDFKLPTVDGTLTGYLGIISHQMFAKTVGNIVNLTYKGTSPLTKHDSGKMVTLTGRVVNNRVGN